MADFSINDKVKLKGSKPRPPRMIGHKQRITSHGNPIVDDIKFVWDGKQGAAFYGTVYTVSEKTDLIDNESQPARINKDFLNQTGAAEHFEITEAADQTTNGE